MWARFCVLQPGNASFRWSKSRARGRRQWARPLDVKAAFLASKRHPCEGETASAAGGGREHALLPRSRVRLAAGFRRLNPDEALGLHSALFLSAEPLHALILSFPPARLPWKCRPLGNAKLCTSCTGSACYFWSQLSSECIPKCQREQVLAGQVQMQTEGSTCNCLIMERAARPAGAWVNSHSIRNARLTLLNINLDRGREKTHKLGGNLDRVLWFHYMLI